VRGWLIPAGILAAVVAIVAGLAWLISLGAIAIKFAE